MSNIKNVAFSTADEVGEELGVYVVDVAYVKENNEWYLKIFIDTDSGIGIDECEKFSVAFSEKFDKLDPITEKYCLIVSSPGLDRTLKTQREFEYYIGRQVDVSLYAPVDGLKEFTGCLSSYDKKNITIDIDGKKVEFPVNTAAFVKLSFTM